MAVERRGNECYNIELELCVKISRFLSVKGL